MWASLPSGQLQRLRMGCCSRSAGAEWGQVPPASPGGGGGSRGLGRSSGRRERCWRPLAGSRGAAAGAGGAGGRWQQAVVWRPAREALEAAGVRRCAQSSQLHDAEFGGQALGGLENSGLAGGRKAGVLRLQRGGEWGMDILPGGAGAGTRAWRLAVRCGRVAVLPVARPRAGGWTSSPVRWRRDASLAARGVLRRSLCRGVACSSRGGARERWRWRTGWRAVSEGVADAGARRESGPAARAGTSARRPPALCDRLAQVTKGPSPLQAPEVPGSSGGGVRLGARPGSRGPSRARGGLERAAGQETRK